MKKLGNMPVVLAALASLFFVGCATSSLSARPSPNARAKQVERSLSRQDARLAQTPDSPEEAR